MTEQFFTDLTLQNVCDTQKRLWKEGDQEGLGRANDLLLAQVRAREGVTTYEPWPDVAASVSPEPQVSLLQAAYEQQGEAFRTHDQPELELANNALMNILKQVDDPRP